MSASDEEAIAYVSLSVNVGSFNEQPGQFGMAHFLEHMIFMGSDKYPGEQEFSNHISESGGDTNAYTEFENTTYYLNIGYNGLKKALDMMAHNFHSPKLDPDTMEREISAIESEYKMNAMDDSVRMIQILQSNTVDKDHIFNRFMFGNKKSLLKNKSLLDGGAEELYNDLK